MGILKPSWIFAVILYHTKVHQRQIIQICQNRMNHQNFHHCLNFIIVWIFRLFWIVWLVWFVIIVRLIKLYLTGQESILFPENIQMWLYPCVTAFRFTESIARFYFCVKINCAKNQYNLRRLFCSVYCGIFWKLFYVMVFFYYI